ncbi:MAG: hypothetical protein MZU91_01205 [Desulfosudis oleivorans]|nr:hypothetical protein [Desulfosudis oleivorans]
MCCTGMCECREGHGWPRAAASRRRRGRYDGASRRRMPVRAPGANRAIARPDPAFGCDARRRLRVPITYGNTEHRIHVGPDGAQRESGDQAACGAIRLRSLRPTKPIEATGLREHVGAALWPRSIYQSRPGRPLLVRLFPPSAAMLGGGYGSRSPTATPTSFM